MKKIVLSVILLISTGLISAQTLPEWITNTKVKGDFRLREEYKDESGKIERYRTRFRFRIGFTTLINENVTLGFNFASGSGDPRSTNVTLGDSEAKKDFNIDSVYFVYKFSDRLVIWGGKYLSIKKALFRPTDLLWDSDITPEGLGFMYKTRLTGNTGVFFNASYMVLDEYKASGADPFLYFVQPGLQFHLGNAKVKAGVAFYQAVHVKGNVFAYSSGTNTLENGVLKYNYSVLNPSFEAKWKVNNSYVEYFKFFAEYVVNTKVDNDDTGYELGIGFGRKLKSKGDFAVKLNYRYLEKDAWLDIFPDSDAFSGETGVKGAELEIKYSLGKNTYLTLDVYDMKKIDDSQSKQKVVQFDINFKF